MPGKEITISQSESIAFELPSEERLKAQLEAINRFQSLVHSTMIQGQDYGTIPGTGKPTLLKPGAEKITKLLGLGDTYELIDRNEDWTKPFFRYIVKCTLSRGVVIVSEGMGECNSMESKYRWREAKKKCPECGKETIIKGKAEYGGGWLCFQKKGGCGAKWPDGAPEIESQPSGLVPNDDIYSLVNTILKMAEKRALIDAALHAGRLSNVFTQDIEDLAENGAITPSSTSEPSKSDVSMKGGIAQPEQAKPTPIAKAETALTGEGVYRKIESLVKNEVWTNIEAKKRITDLGGKGKTWIEMLNSLTPENLVVLDKQIHETDVLGLWK